MSGLELAHPDDVEMLRAAIVGGTGTPVDGNAPRRACATATATGVGST